MSTLNPQKLGQNPGPKRDQKHVFQSFSDSAHQIFLISCMRLEVNSEHVSAKTARPKNPVLMLGAEISQIWTVWTRFARIQASNFVEMFIRLKG